MRDNGTEWDILSRGEGVGLHAVRNAASKHVEHKRKEKQVRRSGT